MSCDTKRLIFTTWYFWTVKNYGPWIKFLIDQLAWVSRSSSTVTLNRNNYLNHSHSLFQKSSPHPPTPPWTEDIKMNSRFCNPFLIGRIWFVTAPLSRAYTKQSLPFKKKLKKKTVSTYWLSIDCTNSKVPSIRFRLSYTKILLTRQGGVFQ